MAAFDQKDLTPDTDHAGHGAAAGGGRATSFARRRRFCAMAPTPRRTECGIIQGRQILSRCTARGLTNTRRSGRVIVRNSLIETKRIEKLALVVIELPHHRSPPQRIASGQQNHCSARSPTTFATKSAKRRRSAARKSPTYSVHLVARKASKKIASVSIRIVVVRALHIRVASCDAIVQSNAIILRGTKFGRQRAYQGRNSVE